MTTIQPTRPSTPSSPRPLNTPATARSSGSPTTRQRRRKKGARTDFSTAPSSPPKTARVCALPEGYDAPGHSAPWREQPTPSSKPNSRRIVAAAEAPAVEARPS